MPKLSIARERIRKRVGAIIWYFIVDRVEQMCDWSTAGLVDEEELSTLADADDVKDLEVRISNIESEVL